MQLTKGAIGNLINRYKAVLKKCHLMNVFGSLAVAAMLVMGGAGGAAAADGEWRNQIRQNRCRHPHCEGRNSHPDGEEYPWQKQDRDRLPHCDGRNGHPDGDE